MIAALTGELKHVQEDRVHVLAGAIVYELLVPASDFVQLQASLGEAVTFYTILYLEGDASRGNLEPRLIGFLREEDRRFFDRFTTVKGIGPKTALRALGVPAGEIAQAIEAQDARFLVGLQGIGKRTAELIIAELSGKVKEFAAAAMVDGRTTRAGRSGRQEFEEDAIAALMALDDRLRRPEAEALLDRAKQSKPEVKTTDVLLREMLRMRSVRG
jgi:Holliday junction DNA helicase RuvA